MPFTDADRANLGSALSGVTKVSNNISLPDPTKKLGEAVNGIGEFLFGGGADIGGAVKKALEEFFKGVDPDIFADLLSKVIEVLDLSEAALKKIGELFGKLLEIIAKHDDVLKPIVTAAQKFFSAVVDILEAGGDLLEKLLDALADLFVAVMKALRKVETILRKVIDVVVGFFVDAFGSVLDALPFALKKGPLDSLDGLKEFGEFLDKLGGNRKARIQERIGFVENSLQELAKILTGDDGVGNPLGQYLLQSVFEAPTKAYQAVLGGQTARDALEDFILSLVDPAKTLKLVSNGFTIHSFLKWLELPGGIPLGKLNQWLNDASTYKDPVNPNPVERQFRATLIAEIDAYVRRSTHDQRALTRIDERTSTGILIDLVCLFFDTVINFTLEPDCYPIARVDFDEFEDVGIELASFSARQIRAAIRATVGSVLRGIWAWSVYNDNLIEGVSAVLGSIFSPLLEGVIRHATLVVEVVSVYPSFNAGSKFFVLHRWNSLEPVQGTTDRLQYVAFIRNKREASLLTPAQKADLESFTADWGGPGAAKPHIKGLIEDVGAYLDVAYQRLRIESRFTEARSDEFIGITRADIQGGNLRVWATSSKKTLRPRPVLRVVHACGSFVMKEPATDGDSYVLEMPESHRPRDVIVRSSLGGVAERSVEFIS